MSQSFDEYQSKYNEQLRSIRGFLAGTRTRATLTKCQEALEEAKEAATAMQAMAEVEGNAMRVREAQMLMNRDIGPLSAEVQRALNSFQRDDLFYHAPDVGSNMGSSDMESLIRNSEEMLRESQTVLADTEYIGNQTLMQMGRQREQLQNANHSLEGVQAAALKAKNILVSMSNRACRTRFGLYASIAVLTAANIFVIYCIIRKHARKNSAADDSPVENDDGAPGFDW